MYRLNCLDEPIFMAVPKLMLTEFGIHYRLESCVVFLFENLYYSKLIWMDSRRVLCFKDGTKIFDLKSFAWTSLKIGQCETMMDIKARIYLLAMVWLPQAASTRISILAA